MRSEALPAVGFEVLVLCCIALELSKDLLGVLEIFPRALRADIEAAKRIRSPAVETGVEEVVWI